MNPEFTTAQILKRPSAYLPIAMSLIAAAIVGVQLMAHGAAAEPDEVAAAHLWQILMAAQLPMVAFFAIRWGSRAPRATMIIIAIQLAAALVALAPVYVLHW